MADERYKDAVKRITDGAFQIHKFEDYPQYARVPIFYGGDRQLHIMQPFDRKKSAAGPEPHDIHEWAELTETQGQIVVSFEALDDFIQALLEFRAARTGGSVHLSPRRPLSQSEEGRDSYGRLNRRPASSPPNPT